RSGVPRRSRRTRVLRLRRRRTQGAQPAAQPAHRHDRRSVCGGLVAAQGRHGAGQRQARAARAAVHARAQAFVREVCAVLARGGDFAVSLGDRRGHADTRVQLGSRLSLPPRQVRRWQPPPVRRPAPRALPWYERLIAWWSGHPWIPAWIAVALTPVALFCLRLIAARAVADWVEPPALALMVVVLLVTIAGAARSSAAHSLSRGLAGGGGALACAALLVLPMTQIIGHRPCPERMGPDRGLHVATQML